MNPDDAVATSGLGERLRSAIHALQTQGSGPLPSGVLEILFEFSHHAEHDPHWVRAAELARSLAVFLGGMMVGDSAAVRQRDTMVDALHHLLLEPDRDLPSVALRELMVAPVAPTQPRPQRGVAILVDQPGLARLLHEPLLDAGFQPEEIRALNELDEWPDAQLPVAILADLDLCQHDPEFVRHFGELARRYAVPPHLFTLCQAEDVEARLVAVRLGATRSFNKPLDVGRLVAVLRGVTAQTAVRPFRILLVDDDVVMGEFHRAVLTRAGMTVRLLQAPLQAPAAIAEFAPDVIVSDLYMPGCNGLELLALLRQDESLADIPIVLISSDDAEELQLESFELGADDFLVKPVASPVLVATVRARAKRARQLRRSRSEYHRLRERVQELERQLRRGALPAAGEIRVSDLADERGRIEGYEVNEIETTAEIRSDRLAPGR